MARNPNTHNFTETEMIFRRNIIYLREKSGLTRHATARKLRMNQAYYYKPEDLKVPMNPTFVYMENIAQAYNLEVWQLFTKLYEQGESEK